MNRNWLLAGAAVVVVALVAGGVYAVQFFTPQRASSVTHAFTLDSPTPAPSGSPVGLAGKWVVVTNSQAGYRAHEKFLEQSSPNDAVAHTTGVTGSVTIDGSGGPLSGTGLSVTADLRGLQSTDAFASHGPFQRDRYVGSMVLETDQFPEARFSAAEVAIPSGLEAGGQLPATAHGNLTVHGTTRAVDIPVTMQLSGGRIEVVGAVTVDMRDYGIGVPSVAFTSVQPALTVEFHLFFGRG